MRIVSKRYCEINMEDLFIKEQGNIFQNQRTKHKPAGVIKKSAVNLGQPCKITHQDSAKINLASSKISPIKENDHIIGFTFECSCGEKAKVIFGLGKIGKP